MVNFNGTKYHYLHNLQGDIIGLVDASGNIVVEYKYDAWGKIIARTGSLVSTLGYLNPFRYRGYVYDEETGLYYLRSRYYNPVWCRFINADVCLRASITKSKSPSASDLVTETTITSSHLFAILLSLLPAVHPTTFRDESKMKPHGSIVKLQPGK